MTWLPSLPEDATVRDVLALDPDVGAALVDLHTALMRGPSPLSPGERELIAAYVSALNACRYCRGVHAETARRFGVDADLLEKLVEDPGGTAATGKLRPLLDLARQLTLDPAGVRRAHVEAALAAGWDERAVHHAIHVAALYAYMNRLVSGHGVEGSPEVWAERGRALHEAGYKPLRRWLRQVAGTGDAG